MRARARESVVYGVCANSCRLLWEVMKMEIMINRKQLRALESLAYWIHEMGYIREYYHGEENSIEFKNEYDRVDKTIHLCFDELDKLGVSFRLQNSVICWAEEWRDYMKTSTINHLQSRFNVTIAN